MKTITFEEFNNILQQHYHWLDDRRNGKCADLSDIDFTKSIASDERFYNSLSLSRLDYANLTNSNFEGVEFKATGKPNKKISFRHCDMKGTIFKNAKLSNIDFSHAHLDHSDFSFAKISNCEFCFIVCGNVKFTNCEFINNRNTSKTNGFYHAELVLVDFSMSEFDWVNFRNCTMNGVSFDRSNMNRMIFKNSTIFASHMIGANITQSTFEGATIIGTSCSGSNLKGSDMSLSRIEKCNFSNSKFNKVQFGFTMIKDSNTEGTGLIKINDDSDTDIGIIWIS